MQSSVSKKRVVLMSGSTPTVNKSNESILKKRTSQHRQEEHARLMSSSRSRKTQSPTLNRKGSIGNIYKRMPSIDHINITSDTTVAD